MDKKNLLEKIIKIKKDKFLLIKEKEDNNLGDPEKEIKNYFEKVFDDNIDIKVEKNNKIDFFIMLFIKELKRFKKEEKNKIITTNTESIIIITKKYKILKYTTIFSNYLVFIYIKEEKIFYYFSPYINNTNNRIKYNKKIENKKINENDLKHMLINYLKYKKMNIEYFFKDKEFEEDYFKNDLSYMVNNDLSKNPILKNNYLNLKTNENKLELDFLLFDYNDLLNVLLLKNKKISKNTLKLKNALYKRKDYYLLKETKNVNYVIFNKTKENLITYIKTSNVYKYNKIKELLDKINFKNNENGLFMLKQLLKLKEKREIDKKTKEIILRLKK